jgi:hypothetical protein
MCPIPNGIPDRVVSLYSSKTVDKKEILRTVLNTGIFCSSDKVGTVYPVQYYVYSRKFHRQHQCTSQLMMGEVALGQFV